MGGRIKNFFYLDIMLLYSFSVIPHPHFNKVVAFFRSLVSLWAFFSGTGAVFPHLRPRSFAAWTFFSKSCRSLVSSTGASQGPQGWVPRKGKGRCQVEVWKGGRILVEWRWRKMDESVGDDITDIISLAFLCLSFWLCWKFQQCRYCIEVGLVGAM